MPARSIITFTMPILERSKLHKDVWSRPWTKIAAELGISSSALKRIRTGMDIPTPVAGYWTRVGEGFRPWNGRAFRQIPGLFPET